MAPPIKTHTLNTLRERCDEEGACLIWRGFYNTQGLPMVYAAHPAGGPGRSGKNVSVRWLTALLAGDAAAQAELEPGAKKGTWRVTCGVAGCVEPTHIRRIDTRAHLAHIARESHANNPVAEALRAERIARTRRAQAGKVDMATMRAAVASPLPAAHVARDIGVSKTSVARWRRRAAARVTTGVWGQLIAR